MKFLFAVIQSLQSLVLAGSIYANVQLGTTKIGQQSSYQFTLTLTTQLQSASTVYFDFDQSLGAILPNPVVCSALTGFTSDPQCTWISNTRIAMSCSTRSQSTFPNYSVQINGITNPVSAFSTTNQIKVSSQIGSTLLDQSTQIYVTYIANVVNSSKGSVQSLNPTVGALASFKATLQIENSIPSNGQIILKFPKWDNIALGPKFVNSMVSSSIVTSCSTPLNSATCTVAVSQSNILPDTVVVIKPFLTSQTPGTTIQVTIKNVLNPPTLQPRSGFEIYTADSQGNLIDSCTNLKLTLQNAATASLGSSYVNLSGQTGLQQQGTYQLFYQISNPIPIGGSLFLILPPQLTFSSFSQLQYTGLANIAQSVQLSAGVNSLQISLNNCIINYLMSGQGVMFTLQGITNPTTTNTTSSFTISSFDEAGFAIESLSQGLTIKATTALFSNVQFYPTLQQGVRQIANDFQVQGTLQTSLDYTAVMTLEFNTDPNSFTIVSDSQCTVSGMSFGIINSMINCQSTQITKQIVVTGFILSSVPAKTQLMFTISNVSIQNPISVRYAAIINIYTSNSSIRLDQGLSAPFYAFPALLSSVQVTPNVFFSGKTQVLYLFTVKSNGQIPQNALVQVVFPPEVLIQDSTLIQTSCNNYFNSGLPQPDGSKIQVSCSVPSPQQVVISNMFQYGKSSSIATFQFTLPGIQNPRAVNQVTSSFQLYVFEDSLLQYGVYNLTQGINVMMLSTSPFVNAYIAPSSLTNRNYTTSYTFNLQTLINANSTDTINIQFPSTVQLPLQPGCLGDQISLQQNLNCALLSSNILSVTLNFKNGGTSAFWFAVTNITNPYTTKPTDSFQITQYNYLGNQVQQTISNLAVQMTNGTVVPTYKLAVKPSSYDSGVLANYLVQFQLGNVVNGMYVQVDFPAEIVIQPNATCLSNVNCTILSKQSNSAIGQVLYSNQTIVAQSNFSFTLSGVLNPVINTVVYFNLRSYTSDGYLIEAINAFKLDFKCVSPCQTCVNGSNTVCASCNPIGYYNLFQGMCYDGCPSRYFLQDNKTCSPCQTPCITCTSWRVCTSCSHTSTYINDICVENPSWSYFCPALILAVLWLSACGVVKYFKKQMNFIPFAIFGLCWVNFLMVIIEMAVYYNHSLTPIMIGEIVCGILLPLSITVVFVVLYMKWVHNDQIVQKHINQHKVLSYFALACCVVSIRCWKIIYSEMSISTSLVSLQATFKRQNMHFSFACIVPDICLALLAASALQQGIVNNIQILILVGVERMIISCAMMTCTLLEYSFKKVTGKDGHNKIQVSSGQAYEIDNNNSVSVSEMRLLNQVGHGHGLQDRTGFTTDENAINSILIKDGENANAKLSARKSKQNEDNLNSGRGKKQYGEDTASFNAKKQMTVVDQIMQSVQNSQRSSGGGNKKSLTKNLAAGDGEGIDWEKKDKKELKSERKEIRSSADQDQIAWGEDNLEVNYNSHARESELKAPRAGFKVKIIYSDRSDTSVEELMEITPSTFNVPNGRVNIQSVGLRGMKDLQLQPRSISEIRERGDGEQKGYSESATSLKPEQRPEFSQVKKRDFQLGESDKRPTDATIIQAEGVNYQSQSTLNQPGSEDYSTQGGKFVSHRVVDGKKTIITKKVPRQVSSNAKQVIAGKKFIEDQNQNRSLSSSKNFGQRKGTTHNEPVEQKIITIPNSKLIGFQPDQSH